MQEVIKTAIGKLKPFVGTWRGEGVFLEGAGDLAQSQLVVTDDYSWLPGKYFLVDSNMLDYGSGKLQAHRIVGYDTVTNQHTIHAFDNKGFARLYKGGITSTTEWHFDGEQERVTFTFNDDTKLTTYWEILINEKWVPLCRTQETRVG